MNQSWPPAAMADISIEAWKLIWWKQLLDGHTRHHFKHTGKGQERGRIQNWLRSFKPLHGRSQLQGRSIINHPLQLWRSALQGSFISERRRRPWLGFDFGVLLLSFWLLIVFKSYQGATYVRWVGAQVEAVSELVGRPSAWVCWPSC